MATITTLVNASQSTLSQHEPPSALSIPDFESVFPYISLQNKLRNLIDRIPNLVTAPFNSPHGQELASFFSREGAADLLLNCNPIHPNIQGSPDMALRQRIQSNPFVTLRGKRTGLTPQIYTEVMALCDDLGIKEDAAFTLYAEAGDARSRSWLENKLKVSFHNDIPKAAREFFFYERGCVVGILDVLIKLRVEVVSFYEEMGEITAVFTGTDGLLSQGLMEKLLDSIRDLSMKLGASLKEGRMKSFLLDQRQRMAECLFYLLYHTQANGKEVGCIVDMIRDLSNELGVLDPMKDIPSTAIDSPSNISDHQMNYWSSNNAPQRIEKKSEQWNEELVTALWKDGKPQCQLCINTLVLSLFCALDCNHVLINRETHRPNSFGKGNSLLPPTETHLSPDETLNTQNLLSQDNWIRKDILGLINASYAMLLAPSLSSNIFNDAQATFHTCLNVASITRALTYARTALLPSFLPEQSDSSNYNFFTSVLAEFTAGYLYTIASSGELLISREKWYRDEEEELSLRKMHEEQHRQLGIGGGKVIPTEVDLSKRPDCMDDIIALAVGVISVNPRTAFLFWDNIGEVPVPSMALKKMAQLPSEDESLLPIYLSFLSALACAGTEEKNGADTIHESLVDPDAPLNWIFLLNAVRWYTDELSDKGKSTSKTSSSNVSRVSTMSSEYYYNDITGNSYNLPHGENTATPSPPVLQPKKVLGESNSMALFSILSLIERLATRSSTAHKDLLGIKLPPTTEKTEEQDVFQILFGILSTSISSELKGRVFCALASLVDKAVGGTVWEMLEMSQVLPCISLGQYEQNLGYMGGVSDYMRNSGGYGSSSASFNQNIPVLASGETLGIYFETTKTEAKNGTYPATEGFLKLITSLITLSGCPRDLGCKWRRPGVSPYIEYVTNFILPRVFTDKKDDTPFNFASSSDRYRLLTRSLEVISAVICRHVVPPVQLLSTKGLSQSDVVAAQMHLSQMKLSANNMGLVLFDLYPEDVSKEHLEDSISDFRDDKVQLSFPRNNAGAHNNLNTPTAPRPKSPGFTILADILGTGPLLKFLLLILVEQSGPLGIETCGSASHAKVQALSLFLDTVPTFQTTKKNILVPSSLFPAPIHFVSFVDSIISNDNTIAWREQTIALTLRILCATAAREEEFSRDINSVPPLTVVPCLKFGMGLTKRNSGSMDVYGVSVNRFYNLLMSSAGASHFSRENMEPLFVMGQYVSCNSCDEQISMASVGILAYVTKCVSPEVAAKAICGKTTDGPEILAEAFARRMLLGQDKANLSMDHGDVRDIILDILLENALCQPPNLAHVLLGWSAKSESADNCFSSILNLLGDPNLLLDPATVHLAEKSYELLYLLCSSKNSSRFHFITKLRNEDFWYNQCVLYFSSDSSTSNSVLETVCLSKDGNEENNTLHHAMHALAWLFKGVALELHSLMGFDSHASGPHPLLCQKLLSILFQSSSKSIMLRTLSALPVDHKKMEKVLPNSLTHARAAVQASSSPLSGPEEFCGHYQVIDLTKLHHNIKNETEDTKLKASDWAEEWNHYVYLSCASAHLSHGWGDLLGSAVLSCRQFFTEDNIIDSRLPVQFICEILLRMLGENTGAGAIFIKNPADGVGFDSGSALPLCVALLRLVELVKHTEDEGNQRQGDENAEDFSAMSTRIASVIASCVGGGKGHQECAAILSCALSLLLSLETSTYTMDFFNAPKSTQWGRNAAAPKEIFRDAAIYLTSLSCVVYNADNSVKGDSKEVAIALAARVGLSSLISFFDEQESSTSAEIGFNNTFLFSLFGYEGESRLSGLINMITSYDTDIAWTLQRVACCKFGAEFLLHVGVTNALLTAAAGDQKMLKDYGTSTDQRETYGSIEFEPPSYFLAHITLLNTLLAAMPNSHQMGMEAAKIINSQIRIGEGILKSYPRNSDLTEKFLTLLSQTVSIFSVPSNETAMSDINQVTGSHQNVLDEILGKSMPRLERRIMDFAFHVATFPLPAKFMSRLPSQLLDMEKSQLCQSRQIATRTEKSWWDLIPSTDSSRTGILFLPDPPIGYGMSNIGATQDWTEEKYECALSAARSLEVALMFLKHRAKRGTVEGVGLALDAIAFAKGLFRCADTVRMITNYLHNLEPMPDANSMTDNMMVDNSSFESKQIERKYLSSLGSILGRCTESMIVLASLYFRFLQKNGLQNNQNRKCIVDFSSAIGIVLGCVEIDKRGIGLIGKEYDEMSRNIARDLMENIQRQS